MNTRYTRTAMSLHWLIAIAIFGTFALGTYMADLRISPTMLKLYSWHKWAGVTIFVLVVARLAWRLGHPPPALPAHMPPLERLAAHAGHLALYGLMFAIPVSGWLMSSALGFQTVWFGVLPLPDLVAKDAALGDLLQQVHLVLNYMLLALVVMHVAAALKHHFINRDDVLLRMLPQVRKTSPGVSATGVSDK